MSDEETWRRGFGVESGDVAGERRGGMSGGRRGGGLGSIGLRGGGGGREEVRSSSRVLRWLRRI